jgi:hypothetical protein
VHPKKCPEFAPGIFLERFRSLLMQLWLKIPGEQVRFWQLLEISVDFLQIGGGKNRNSR